MCIDRFQYFIFLVQFCILLVRFINKFHKQGIDGIFNGFGDVVKVSINGFDGVFKVVLFLIR